MSYNAICPKCNDRYNAMGVKPGEIAVRTCSSCPAPKLDQPPKPELLHQDKRRAQPSLTGDRFAALPGEYEERRKSRKR